MQKIIKYSSSSPGTLWYRFVTMLCLAFIMSLMIVEKVSTQTQPGDDWLPPSNLSNSGSTSDPIVLVDSQNITHVIWLDAYEGYKHSQAGEDGVWSEPVEIVVPFNEIQPRVILGPNDLVYTFWLTEGNINYSRVRSINAGLSNAWERERILASDILAFDVNIDADLTIHIAYIKQSIVDTLQAGVYYRQKPASKDWTTGQLIYGSQYFRTMEPARAHISVAAGNLNDEFGGDESSGIEVYVAWDEPFMFRSMISHSPDGSDTWIEPEEIDPFNVATGGAIAFEPDLMIWNDQVLLVWKKELSVTTCEILYKVSDENQNWSTATELFSSYNGCPKNSTFLMHNDDMVIWQADIGKQVVLTAWNGADWSEPRAEPELTGFWNPKTGQTMTLGNLNVFYLASSNRLLAVGCDTNGNLDTWFTWKSLNEAADWFLPYSVWEPVREINMAFSGINNAIIATDVHGKFHTVWVQVPNTVSGSQAAWDDTDRTIHYAWWDGVNWSDPSSIIKDSEGSPYQVAIATSDGGRLMVIWRREVGCQIVFTSAPVDRAFNTVEWMDQVTLPTLAGTCSSPTLAVDDGDNVYAAYAVAINEGRGIYLNRSTDGGYSWDGPIQVFDAQAASWEMVDQPILAIADDRLHMLWQRKNPLEPGVGLGLGYAYSDDDGLTWSTADTSINTQLHWADLVVTLDEKLVRVWQGEYNDQLLISTQNSSDGGQSWTYVTSVSCNGELMGSPDLIIAPSGQIHLLQILRNEVGKAALRHWIWDFDNWVSGESLDIGYRFDNPNVLLSGVVSPQGQLGVIYTAGNLTNRTQSLNGVVSQTGSEPNSLPVSQQSAAEPLPTSVVAMSAEAPTQTVPENPASTLTAEESVPQFANEQANTTRPWIGLIFGSIFAFIVIGMVFWKRISRVKR